MEPNQTSLSPKRIALGLLILVIGIIVGAAASYSTSYQSGFDAAKAIVAKSNFGATYMTPDDVRTIVGTVTSIGDNQLTLTYRSLDPFAEPSLDERTVLIDASTAISRSVPRDTEVVQAEVTAFLAQKASSTVQSAQLPATFTRVVVAFSDIARGDALTVTAFENIKDAKEFLAKEIQIQPRAGAPAQ